MFQEIYDPPYGDSLGNSSQLFVSLGGVGAVKTILSCDHFGVNRFVVMLIATKFRWK